MVKKPLGFGDIPQTAEFFGIARAEVSRLARSGEWPSYIISGRRVFDLDDLVKRLARQGSDDGEAIQ